MLSIVSPISYNQQSKDYVCIDHLDTHQFYIQYAYDSYYS